MNAAPEESGLTRSALRYHGGKWRIAPWVIAHFPPHDVYVEPFGGGASVLLRKERSRGEVYNDIDGRIVNIFRVMQNPETAAELASRLYFTPYSREEYYAAFKMETDDPIEQARQMIVRSYMGFGSNAITSTRKSPQGFRSRTSGGYFPSREWATYPELLRGFTMRLRGVVLDNRDAMRVMTAYDSDIALHYVDPPYLAGLRNKTNAKKSYINEMTDDDHATLCEFLKTLAGNVVLSGYDNDIYNSILAGWKKIGRAAMADLNKATKEFLWISPRAWNSLHRQFSLMGA